MYLLYTLSSMKQPKLILADLPAVFTYSEARAAGISDRRLYSYRDLGYVDAIGRGLYRWAENTDSDPNLLEIARRVPRATLCLISALAHHDLTDIIPPRTAFAIPRGSRTPKLHSPVEVHVFARQTFELGRGSLQIGADVSIGLYSAERSLVDFIRLRHREGAEVAWEALRRWLRRRGSQPAVLIGMAQHFHGAERAIRNALEIVQ